MERWRWLPRDLGAAYVIVNIPDHTLTVMNDGKSVWSTRIVVGQPGKHATPLLAETMKYITFNPTWNVPPSIIRNEYLPALARDPTALARIGLRIGRNSDGSIRIYQPRSERNALGRLRFNFPNQFLVYQHDTPDKHLFRSLRVLIVMAVCVLSIPTSTRKSFFQFLSRRTVILFRAFAGSTARASGISI
jgi:L,D-transpeptidase YcbB